MKEMKMAYYIIMCAILVFILFAFLPMNTAILIVGALILVLAIVVIIKSQKKPVSETENEILPNGYQLINKEQIKTYFTNLEPLNEEDFKELRENNNKRTIIAILCILVAVGLPFILGDVKELKETLYILGMIFIFTVLTNIIKFIRTGSITNNYNNCLKAKLYIYDKKAQGYDDSGAARYYARVWDGNKYVINEWLYLPTPLYNSTEVIVYFKEYENNIKMFIYNKKGI